MIQTRIVTLILLTGCFSIIAPAIGANGDFFGQGLFNARASVGAQNYANGFNFGQLFGVQNQASSVQYANDNGFYAGDHGHRNVLTNGVQVAGVPISNTISTNHGISGAGHSSGFLNTLNIGNLGLSAGLASDHVGRVGVTRTPDGGLLLNLGALSFGVGHSISAAAGSGVQAQASGDGSATSSESSSFSQEHSLGLVSVSESESQSVANANSHGGQVSVVAQGQLNYQTQPQYLSDKQYYDKYYQDYYDNYYKNHPQYQPQQPQPHQPKQETPQPQNIQPIKQKPTQNQPSHPSPSLPSTQPIVPVQPKDETHFKDHYNQNSPLQPSSYASENYFDKPASPNVPNYYIAPKESEAITSQHTVPSHPHVPSTTTSPALEGILNDVFKPATKVPSETGGKSLADLLMSLPEEENNNDVAGGEFGLDVRSESRRRRSLERPKRRAYRHHYEEEDDDDDDDDDHYHHHHHHHSFGRQHGRDYHGGCNKHEHSHSSQPNHKKESTPQPDIRPIHENTGEEPIDQRPKSIAPLAPFPKSLSTETPNKVPAPRDLSPEFNFDVRSNFNETRRKRNVASIRNKRQDEAFVFGSDEDVPAAVEVTTTATAAEPASVGAANPATAEEDEFEECELGEEDCEPASLDNRFGFLTGMRRRRPFGGILGGIVQDIVHSIADTGNQYDRNYPTYPQQPQYPQQPHYQQPPTYPQPGPHQQYTQPGQHQQYPQPPPRQPQYTNQPHPPPSPHQPPSQYQQQPIQQYYPDNNNNHQYQQSSGANTQSQNYQDQFGQYQQNGGSSQSSNLAADGSAGQLSAANTMQQSYQNQFGSGNKNAAQSQSANFDNHGNLALNNANANTQHIQGPNGERDEANSGAHSTLQNQFGTSTSGSQADTQNYNENGKRGTQSHGSSQSLFHGKDGSLSGSNSDATSNTFEGPFGIKGSQTSSHSSSFNNGGGGGSSSSASSGSGNGFGGFGGAQSGAQSGSFNGGAGSQANAGSGSYGADPEYFGDLPVFG